MNSKRYLPLGDDVYIDQGNQSRQPPPRRLIEFIVVLVIIVILTAILFPVFMRFRCDNKYVSCQSNLKQIGLAIMQYNQDYDEHFPLIYVNDTHYSGYPDYTTPYGWADAFYPYCKSLTLLHCPSGPLYQGACYNTLDVGATASDPAASNFTDYWYNANLDGKPLDDATFPAELFLCGEGNSGEDAANAHYSLSHLPTLWAKNSASPAYRHLDGANYLYADGHVKWLKGDMTTVPKYNYAHFGIGQQDYLRHASPALGSQ